MVGGHQGLELVGGEACGLGLVGGSELTQFNQLLPDSSTLKVSVNKKKNFFCDSCFLIFNFVCYETRLRVITLLKMRFVLLEFE